MSRPSTSSPPKFFDRNSRSAWMEQQLFHDNLIPREITPVGPAAYCSKPIERNVSTPFIGKKPYFDLKEQSLNQSYYNLSTPSLQNSSSIISAFDPEKEVQESSTIFHGHDRRNPFDPHGRYCQTSGPSLGPDSFLTPITISGKNKVQLGTFSKSYSSDKIRESLSATYDLKQSDDHLRKSAKMVTFSKSNRIYIPLKDRPLTSCSSKATPYNSFGFTKENENYVLGEGSFCSDDRSNLHPNNSILKNSTNFGSFLNDQYREDNNGQDNKESLKKNSRFNLVKYPKLKFRSKPNVLCVDFDELKKEEMLKKKREKIKEKIYNEKNKNYINDNDNDILNHSTFNNSIAIPSSSSSSRIVIDIKPSEINKATHYKPFQNVLILPRPHSYQRRL